MQCLHQLLSSSILEIQMNVFVKVRSYGPRPKYSFTSPRT